MRPVLGSIPPPCPTVRVGIAAKLTGVRRRTLMWWIERGWIDVIFHPRPQRNVRRIPVTELDIARRAAEHLAQYGGTASDKLFTTLRRAA